MNSDIPLDLYKVFYAVVTAGNMSGAAKTLYISQPAVSMAIRNLETKLGGTLLVRTPKGVRTTTEGQVLYTYLDQALSLIAIAEKKYYEMLNLESGEVKIGASDTILDTFMMPYLEKYNHSFPDINIKITSRTTDGALNVLRRGEVDLAFVNLPIEKDDMFEVCEFLEVQDILICGEKHRHLAKKGLHISEIPEHPVLLLEKDSNARKYVDNFLFDNGVALKPVFELGSAAFLINFVKKSWGLTFVTRELTDDIIDNKLLFEIPLSPPIPKRKIGIAWLKGVEISNAAKRFANMFYK